MQTIQIDLNKYWILNLSPTNNYNSFPLHTKTFNIFLQNHTVTQAILTLNSHDLRVYAELQAGVFYLLTWIPGIWIDEFSFRLQFSTSSTFLFNSNEILIFSVSTDNSLSVNSAPISAIFRDELISVNLDVSFLNTNVHTPYKRIDYDPVLKGMCCGACLATHRLLHVPFEWDCICCFYLNGPRCVPCP